MQGFKVPLRLQTAHLQCYTFGLSRAEGAATCSSRSILSVPEYAYIPDTPPWTASFKDSVHLELYNP